MWSRRSIEILAGVALLAAVTACSVTARRAAQPAPTTAAAGHPASATAQAAPAGPPPIPAEAKAEFERAVTLARAGNDVAAEAQLTSLASRYPRFCTPLVDLGILYRKSGRLDAAASALQQAVARDPHSALAWTELGVTQRLDGRFQDAEESYGHAIAADPAYAAAYRNRGVLRDLYLDQPAAALADFEQYRKLTSQDKAAAMWIAELQHRTGIKEPAAQQHPPATAGTVAPPAAQTGTAPAKPPQARN